MQNGRAAQPVMGEKDILSKRRGSARNSCTERDAGKAAQGAPVAIIESQSDKRRRSRHHGQPELLRQIMAEPTRADFRK